MTTLSAITAMLLASSAPNAVPAEQLAPQLLATALQHDVDPKLLTRIVLLESRGVATAYNARTADHGLVQINEATRKAYGLSNWCMRIWQCNLNAGARILADMYNIADARPCVYNLGPKGRFEKYKNACTKYETMLAQF